MTDTTSLVRAKEHLAAALSAADEARDSLLGARLCQCVEWIDMELDAAVMATTLLAQAAKRL